MASQIVENMSLLSRTGLRGAPLPLKQLAIPLNLLHKSNKARWLFRRNQSNIESRLTCAPERRFAHMNQPRLKHESRVVVICRKLGQWIRCVALQFKQFVERAEEVLIALVEEIPGVRTLKKALDGWAQKHPVDAHELCVAVTVGLVILATWIAPSRNSMPGETTRRS